MPYVTLTNTATNLQSTYLPPTIKSRLAFSGTRTSEITCDDDPGYYVSDNVLTVGYNPHFTGIIPLYGRTYVSSKITYGRMATVKLI